MEFTKLQDLGDMTITVLQGDSETETTRLHSDGRHIDTQQALREFLWEHYGEHLNEISGENDLLITSVTFEGGSVPEMEYVSMNSSE
jgi:hypothetical protein